MMTGDVFIVAALICSGLDIHDDGSVTLHRIGSEVAPLKPGGDVDFHVVVALRSTVPARIATVRFELQAPDGSMQVGHEETKAMPLPPGFMPFVVNASIPNPQYGMHVVWCYLDGDLLTRIPLFVNPPIVGVVGQTETIGPE